MRNYGKAHQLQIETQNLINREKNILKEVFGFSDETLEKLCNQFYQEAIQQPFSNSGYVLNELKKCKNMDTKKIYLDTIQKWGERAQLEMLQEETTELALATRKFIRKNDEDSRIQVANEIADVQIMIEQFLFMFPEMQVRIENEKTFKLLRLQKRVENNQFESND